jgi:L-fuconolactonase
MARLDIAAHLAYETGPMNSPDDSKAAVPIVDTHQHLWDLAKFRLPWLADAPPLNKPHVMADYLKATEGLNVVKSIYMEVDVEPGQRVEEAKYISDICRRGDSPTVAAVVSGSPALPDFKDYLKRFKGSRHIKGVRSLLIREATPPGYCVRKEFIQGVRLLGEQGMSFDICIRPGELGDAAKLAAACPGTRFILDHCGNAKVCWAADAPERRQWQRGIAEVALRKNVVCKISGIVASAKPGEWTAADLAPYVKHCIAEFGWDRVMFGSDWPVCTLAATCRQWVEALQEIVRAEPADNHRKLFHDNAAWFYRLR